MEGQAVPFPSVSRFNDEISPERRNNDRTPHGRVKSSPSLPDWSLQIGNSGARPRLNPLDLAVAHPATPPPFSKYLQPLSPPSPHSAQNSPRKESFSVSTRTASGSPHRLSALLTPPLTPSSSFNSASTVATESDFGGDADVVPGTPPDGGSPLTWGKLGLKRPSIAEVDASDDITVGFTSANDSVAELNARMRKIDLTPRLEKKLVFGNIGEQDIRSLVEGEKTLDDESMASRFLLVHHVSARTTESDMRNALSRLGVSRIKGIIRVQPQGLILIVFYDLRDAIRSATGLDGKTVGELNKNGVRLSSSLFPADERKGEDLPLRVEYTDKATLEKMLQNRPPTIWVGTESTLLVEAFSTNRGVEADEVYKIMTSLGALVEFRPASPRTVRALRASGLCGSNRGQDSQVFFADYYDSETAATARQQLDNRTIFHMRLRIFWTSDLEGVSEGEPEKEQAVQEQMPYPLLSYASLNNNPGVFDLSSPPLSSSLPLPESPTPKRGGGHTDFGAQVRRSGETEPSVFPSETPHRVERGRVDQSTANPSHYGGLFFDSLDRAPPSPHNPDRSHNTSLNADGRDPHFSNFHYAYSLFDSVGPASPNVQPYPPSNEGYFASQPLVSQPTGFQIPPPGPYQPFEPYFASANAGHGAVRDAAGWIYPSGSSIPEDLSPAGGLGERNISSGRIDGRKHLRPTRGDRASRSSSSTLGRSSSGSSFEGSFASSLPAELAFGEDTVAEKAQISEKNQLNIANIENGLDTRTTVMIKNIPNKMSDQDLMEFIDRVCPRRIDFLYLRMDFQNGCNVGYAFVNFINVQDLLHFAKTQLGVKWNMYSSEKVLQMSYANYQGKEALVEKFKNSCIMDEREAWRPKIFFSDGLSQGLPEPFPPPTHLRRKERSASNRGALFVPGVHHYNGQCHGHGHGYRQQPQYHGHFREQGFVPRF